MTHRSRFLFVALVATMFVAAAGTAVAKPDNARSNAKKTHVLRLTLGGQTEGHPPFSLFGDVGGQNVRKVAEAIRHAATDPKVDRLWLRVDGLGASWAQVEELRRALLEFRRAGKGSHCHMSTAGTATFLVASACSDVSMTPTGMLELPGLSAEMMYMKGLFSKIGIEFQELRMGRYKSAVEGMTRTGPSDAVVEQMNALLDSLFETIVDDLAKNRGLEPVTVRALIDRAMFRPSEAKAAGLIDRVEYEDAFRTRIVGAGKGAREVVDLELEQQLELDFSGFSGIFKLMNVLMGGGDKKAATKTPKLAVIYGVGGIVQHADVGLFGGLAMTSDEMVKHFRRARNDDSVKAVVFRVDSPGGSALASDLIWREVKLTAAKKPVIVSMGSVAASGGYYVSAAATQIYAEATTITGSIGVIGAIPNMKGLADWAGVSMTTFHRGKRAAIISPYGELTPEGRRMFMKMMRDVYGDFLDRVAEGRGMSRAAVESIAEGRVWTGRDAQKLGLVDAIGGLDAAMARARELGRLPADVEIIELPRKKTLADLFSSGGLRAEIADAVLKLPESAKAILRQAEWFRAVKSERVLAVMPDVIRIR